MEFIATVLCKTINVITSPFFLVLCAAKCCKERMVRYKPVVFLEETLALIWRGWPLHGRTKFISKNPSDYRYIHTEFDRDRRCFDTPLVLFQSLLRQRL